MAQQPNSQLAGRRILLGVSGGIAAYKAPELVRQLRAAQADVRVVLTRSAHQFVTPTSLQAVSGAPVRDDLWDPAAEAAMGHIELARWADTLLLAPATAHLTARLAQGQADDLLTTLCLASTAPLVVAPAMNVRMWQHPATQANIDLLRSRGARVLGPAEGEQACGEFGPGRMLDPEAITAALAAPAEANPLSGARVLITAGPTREAIDPVRYISNRSSGRQGYALAATAARLGAQVTLISGPTALPEPAGVHRVDVQSAQDMHAAVLSHLGGCHLFVGVAAVADYRVRETASRKMKKSDSPDGVHLELVENPDIIASVASQPVPPVTVGFAAETHEVLDYARTKLKRKNLDMIVVNDVSDQRIGFAGSHNAVTIIWADGEVRLARDSKDSIARQILDQVTRQFSERLRGAGART